MSESVTISAAELGVEQVVRVATGRVPVVLSEETAFRARLEAGAEVVRKRIEQRIPTYGVNTGFGASCINTVDAQHARDLAANLPEYHGCGVGPLLDETACRAVLVVRLASLAQGYSGVRPLVIEHMAALLNAGIAPAIPERGSVGASGDLTPLSYVAAALEGRRQVWSGGELMSSAQAHERSGLKPIQLGPKETLAIMNGTAVMTGLMALCHVRALRLSKVASIATAAASLAVGGQAAHFDERIFVAKGHPGQAQVAGWIRDALGVDARPTLHDGRIQDPYSLRCAPHVIGVLVDCLPFFASVLSVEIGGASDNPLFDPDTGDVLHGGNFYGGHVAMVADTLKTNLANVADLLDRQVVLLNNPATNGGLPENLKGVSHDAASAHHGFKAMEITASSLTAEALQSTMPASVFSRSTEGHNQDKVSMGTIAARTCLRVLELTEQVAAVHLLAACQAMELSGRPLSDSLQSLLATVRERSAQVVDDRPLDVDIVAVTELIRQGTLAGCG